jgi:hypothetical protein
MSLTTFLGMPDVAAKVKPLHPKLPRKIPAQLMIEPRSNRYMLVGTAFDYLLRFELQRRAPHALSDRWVAELAPDILWQRGEKGGSFTHVFKDANGVISVVRGSDPGIGDEELARETSERARSVVDKAKSAFAAYLKTKAPTLAEQTELARHAIRLAKLEELYRRNHLDPTFEEAAQEDADDLVSMLAIVPFESLLHDKVLVLNPSFGEASHLVGGTDADLISGNILVDFKATKRSEMQATDLDSLFAFFLLAREQRRIDGKFPEISRAGFYFCRHAHLWLIDATAWTNHADFEQVEQWFLNRARKLHSIP